VPARLSIIEVAASAIVVLSVVLTARWVLRLDPRLSRSAAVMRIGMFQHDALRPRSIGTVSDFGKILLFRRARNPGKLRNTVHCEDCTVRSGS
jgi:hypothetical protein